MNTTSHFNPSLYTNLSPEEKMMTSQYGQSGVCEISEEEYLKHKLNSDTEQQILAELTNQISKGKVNPLSKENKETFIYELNFAVFFYKKSKIFHEQSLPGVVRKNLTNAITSNLQLLSSLSQLDSNSALLLHEVSDYNKKETFDFLHNLNKSLKNSILKSNEYGNPTQLYKKQFAGKVGVIIRRNCEARITSTEGGFFVSILDIILSDTEEKTPLSVKDLALEGIKEMSNSQSFEDFINTLER